MTGASGPIKPALDYNVELGTMRVLLDVDAEVSEVVETVFVVFVMMTQATGRQKKDASDATPVLSIPLNKGTTTQQGEPKSP